MNAIDGRGGGRGGVPVGGGAGSNGGPSITAASFAAAAAAAAAASNGSNSAIPTIVIPGVSAPAAGVDAASANSVQKQQQQQQQLQESGATLSEMMKNRREYTLLKKLVQLLQDNRLKPGDEEAAEKLRELNRSQNESFPVLKSILNAIFITTGVVLLIAVVVVIAYTSIVKTEGILNGATDSSPYSEIEDDDDDSILLTRSPHRPPTRDPSPPQGMPQNDGTPGQPPPATAGGAKICRTVPIEQEGENQVRLVPLCFHASSSSSSSSSSFSSSSANDRSG